MNAVASLIQTQYWLLWGLSIGCNVTGLGHLRTVVGSRAGSLPGAENSCVCGLSQCGWPPLTLCVASHSVGGLPVWAASHSVDDLLPHCG